jgi:hypothetical protein
MTEIDQAQVWRELKWGKFSASEEWKLTFGGKADKLTGLKPLFGDGAETYIKKVARQAFTMYNDEDQPMTYAMKLGVAKEPISFAELIRQLGVNNLTYYGGNNPRFDLFTNDSGTSPDAVAWADEAVGKAMYGAELKNPSGDVHMHYLLNIKDNATLKEHSIEYFTQVQKAMLTYGCDMWMWCSHNEFFPPKHKLLIVEIKADKNFQNELEARIDAATKEKYKFIEQLKSI